MKHIIRLTICLLFMGMGYSLSAQKVGYVNLEAVLAFYPEMQALNEGLNEYGTKLQEQLKIKQDYATMKYQEFLAKQQEGAGEEEMQSMQAELQKLQAEIQTYQMESQQKLAERRQDEMEPIFDSIQDVLDSISDAEGYDIIINSVDGSGLSVVLYGPEEHNLTKKVMEKLGIEIPETASADN